MAGQQISPGIAHSLSRLCLSHLRSRLPCRYWTSKRLAFSSDVYASYVLPVRQASVLPSASFRFHLTVDTLAVRLMIPPAGVIGVLHSLASAPCRAHQRKSQAPNHVWLFSFCIQYSQPVDAHLPNRRKAGAGPLDRAARNGSSGRGASEKTSDCSLHSSGVQSGFRKAPSHD